jgi:type VI secretion system protein ImpL
VPGAMRTRIEDAMRRNASAAVLSTIAQAASASTLSGEEGLQQEIKSFRDAAPTIRNILGNLYGAPGAAQVATRLDQQGANLLQRLKSELDSLDLYGFSAEALAQWTGAQPLSLSIWGVGTPEALDEHLSERRTHLRSLAVDLGQPVEAFLKPRGSLPAPTLWTGIATDLQAYDAKKPGNSPLVLENWIRSAADKITPDQGCVAPSAGTANSGDYFLQQRSKIQDAVAARCRTLLLDNYNSNIARPFVTSLQGRFPFTRQFPKDSQMADPQVAGAFLQQVSQEVDPFSKYVKSSRLNQQELDFLQSAIAAARIFAGGFDAQPYVDLTAEFRANRSAEKSANEIISWEFGAGDQSVAVFGKPDAYIRWQYGEPVRLILRFALNSPHVPLPDGNQPEMRVSGRTVTWEFTSGWALFELLAKHDANRSDAGKTSGSQGDNGLLRFDIPLVSDPKGSPAGARSGSAVVYVRLHVRTRDLKDPKPIPWAPFPFSVPTLDAR